MWSCHVFSVHGIGWAARGLLWVSRSPQADLLKAGLGNLQIPLLPHHGKAFHGDSRDTHSVKRQEAQILGGHFGRSPTADST